MKAMKMIGLFVLVSLFTIGTLPAQENKTKARKDKTKVEKMADTQSSLAGTSYLVIAPHTKEQCLKSLDDMSAKGSLSKFKFGCSSGDHTGYAFINASDEEAVRKMLPKDNLSSVKIEKVETYTPDQVRKWHKE